jgi:hypothetical protein
VIAVLLGCVWGRHQVAARDARTGLTAGYEHRIGCEVVTSAVVSDAAGNVLWTAWLPPCDWTVGTVFWEGPEAVFRCGEIERRAGPWTTP